MPHFELKTGFYTRLLLTASYRGILEADPLDLPIGGGR